MYILILLIQSYICSNQLVQRDESLTSIHNSDLFDVWQINALNFFFKFLLLGAAYYIIYCKRRYTVVGCFLVYAVPLDVVFFFFTFRHLLQ